MNPKTGIAPLISKLDLLKEGEEYILCTTKRNKIKKKKIKIIKCYESYYLVETKNGWKESILKGDIMTESCYIEGLDLNTRIKEALDDKRAKIKEDESVKLKKDSWGKLIDDGLEWLIRNPGEQLNIVKLGEEHKKELSYYLRSKLKSDIEDKGKQTGYNITLNEQTRQLIYIPGSFAPDPGGSTAPDKVEYETSKTNEVFFEYIEDTAGVPINEHEVFKEIAPEEGQCKCGSSKSDDILLKFEGLTFLELLRITGEGVVFDIIVRKQPC
jgi:hypothetical protein